MIIIKDGRLFEVISSWKDMDRDEYLRIIQRTLNYKIDKKLTNPMFMVMFGHAPSEFGLLKDI